MGAVQNAMQRDGLDTSIIDLDPERSVASQIDKGKDGPPLKGDPLLKEDPTYSKYFAMLKMVRRICPLMWLFKSAHPDAYPTSSDNSRDCRWGLS